MLRAEGFVQKGSESPPEQEQLNSYSVGVSNPSSGHGQRAGIRIPFSIAASYPLPFWINIYRT
jgi:hypothetical protein